MANFEVVVRLICSFVWSVPFIAALLALGFYFSFKLKFLQLRYLKLAFRYVLKPSKEEAHLGIIGDISSFGSLCTALSATLGTGNIVGIAVAMSVGGPGTLLWIVLSSFFSLATKYCEGFLSIKYRQIGSDGKIAGGPMYYIEKSLKSKFLAKVFAICGGITAMVGTGTLAQTNSMAAAANFFGVPSLATAIVVGGIVALVIFGGIHRISDVAEKIVPFMTILYLGAALIILVLKANLILPACQLIIHDAFSPQALIGGTLGSALIHSIQTGVSRGIFCHEAGLGSAAIASAAAKIKSPEKQGLICMVGAFLSVIICVVTGLILIVSFDLVPVSSLTISETSMTALAFAKGLGAQNLGQGVVNVSILFFAFTTIIGWAYYGEKCIQYIFSTRSIAFYRGLYVFFVLIGPFVEIKTIFVIADIVIAFMTIPNIISIFVLRKQIITETIKYFKKLNR